MAFSIVAHTIAGSSNGSNITTSAIDTTGADLLILVTASFGGGSPFTPTDSKGNTWTGKTIFNDGTEQVQVWYATNVSGKVGSGHTFTIPTTGGFPSVAVLAVSGALTSADPFDVQAGATAASGTSLATGSLTPGQDNELLVTGAATNGTPTFAVNGGFTKSDSISNTGNNFACAMGYLIQTTATAANPSWSGWPSQPASVTIATFKAAAGAADTLWAASCM